MTYSRAEASIETEIFTDPVDNLDVLVGLVSDGDTTDVHLPLTKAYEGLNLTYPRQNTAVACCDSSRLGDLRNSFLDSSCPLPRIYVSADHGRSAKINSLFNLMHLAKRLKAKVVVVLDADLQSVKRTWIGRLAEPICSGQADFTSPLYHSLKFDIPVTSIFGYPMFRAIFGRRLRQPFYTDRAFSQKLNERFLAYKNWPVDLSYQATELTMAVLAIADGGRFCQSFMAAPRMYWQNCQIGAETGLVFQDAAAAVFSAAENFPEVWSNAKRSKPTLITGTELTPSIIAPRDMARPEDFMKAIAGIAKKQGHIWRKAFDGRKDWVFEMITSETTETINMNAENWAGICFKSLLAYRRLDPAERADFLEALSAVFFARLLTWLKNGSSLNLSQMEALTEEECRIFEANRRLLVDGWGT
ncbi:MAG: hypothetical protein LBJ64_00540 [Deltaproteobacteria bacterium]|jgi:hypothetical protein|nr:hypothetical protein [Deltaproteobacteria bacterium]